MLKVDWLKVVVEDFYSFFEKNACKAESETLDIFVNLIYYIFFFSSSMRGY